MTRWKPYYKSLFEVYLEQETSAILEDKLHEKAVERAKCISENSLRNIQNQHVNTTQGDGQHVQYVQLGNTEEDVWHNISNPALHLTGSTSEFPWVQMNVYTTKAMIYQWFSQIICMSCNFLFIFLFCAISCNLHFLQSQIVSFNRKTLWCSSFTYRVLLPKRFHIHYTKENMFWF